MVGDISSKRFRPKGAIIFALFVLLVLSIAASLGIGTLKVSFGMILRVLLSPLGIVSGGIPETTKVIIVDVRLPRIILAVFVGAGLSVSGCAMQGLFRNPMASPFVTGIASAGAFGAALVVITGLGTFWITPVAFFISLSTAFFVYYLAKTKTSVPVETLLLAGVAMSLLFSALVSFLQYIANERELREIVLWLMGRLWEANWEKVGISSPLIFIGTISLMLLSRQLNLMLMGDKAAIDLGVEVETLRKIVLVLVSFITSAAVAVTGIIGFVGLIIPHIMRMAIGPDHKFLLPASSLAGAIFLLWTDTLARTVLSPTELPVGIITAILGVPFFLFLLKRRKRLLGFSYGT